MKINLSDGQTFYLYIMHDRENDKPNHKFPFEIEDGVLKFNPSLARGTHVTLCNKYGSLIAKGSSYCCPPDRFRKRRGIAYAMKRCLKEVHFTKVFRTEIYKQVFGQ